jgi:hypothetical protein
MAFLIRSLWIKVAQTMQENCITSGKSCQNVPYIYNAFKYRGTICTFSKQQRRQPFDEVALYPPLVGVCL